jgi:acyl carrier protein
VADLAAQALDEIARVLREELSLPRAPQPGDDLVLDLQLDSVGLLTLVVALEDRFRVRLDEGDAMRVRTVADLCALVAERAAAAPAEEIAP